MSLTFTDRADCANVVMTINGSAASKHAIFFTTSSPEKKGYDPFFALKGVVPLFQHETHLWLFLAPRPSSSLMVSG